MIDQDTMVRSLLTERVKMLGFIQSLIRRHDLAEDVFQDVCAAAMKKREVIRDEIHLRHWMRTVARRQVLNILRKRQENFVLLDEDVIDALEPVWESYDDADAAARAEALRQCLTSLSKPNQELVRKRFVENYDCTRLADESKRSLGSIYVTFSRIYSALGKCISSKLMVAPGGLGGRLD